MNCRSVSVLWVLSPLLLIASVRTFSQEASLPQVDRRAAEIRDLDTPCSFQPPRTKEEWLVRAKYLRRQILMSAGLWPPPEKTPLNTQISGKIEKKEYSIEKVYFESYPGFYVTGNLYRPVGKKGPFPGILMPHGHWEYGRLENSELCTIPGRGINLALQGYVAFAYDMVGYNDSRQVDHRFIGKPLSLWGIGPLGLQLWNSIRSADFLESLPDVDKSRLACTGASGGGTQTFLLTAVDDRIQISAPVNMISHYMQGGDVCENISNLRLDTNNMEIGALMAPRPLLLVSAAGDWTRDTPRIEFPAIQSVYKLFGAEDKVRTVQFVAPHNYNRDSREAVYAWFGNWLSGQKGESGPKERSFELEPPSNMLVFYGRGLPNGAKTQQQLIEYLMQTAEKQTAALKPRDAASLEHFREVMGSALQQAIAVRYPESKEIWASTPASTKGSSSQEFWIGRRNEGDRVPAKLWTPKSKKGGVTATLLIHQDGKAPCETTNAGMLSTLLKQGHLVLAIDTFNTGAAKANRDMSDRFFTTYNRTDDANRVQDILTAIAYLKTRPEVSSINLVGLEKAGLWCLLARALSPEIQNTVADVSQFRNQDDQAYLDQLYLPLIRKAGDFRTALTVAPPTKLLIHNTGSQFETQWVREAYQISKAESALRIESGKVSEAEIISWLK
jgi:dienelactone hydrolase